ncbi:MAG: MBL fold metallo-hydrolase [Ectothiorhodospiraceae bacterium]|nr:MBL fold metallo-hydrolase [Ectothiorhodospiraceae bacterium]
MSADPVIRYFGWSALSLTDGDETLYFDPFFRPYCGAHWFDLEDFADATLVCVTHGHEEHFLDVPVVARATGATVVGDPTVTRFLARRRGIPAEQLITARPFEPVALRGLTITTFNWKHRDINLWKALSKAVFQGNATQLSWAWSSATRAPFYAPYTGFHVRLPSGRTVLNYNEGFNTKMTDAEIADLGRRLPTDVLLAGMQLDFVDDVARGAAALDPEVVLLYPPHDKFHAMMGATSRPWSEFAAAVRAACPRAEVVIAEPGTTVALDGTPVTRGRTNSTH